MNWHHKNIRICTKVSVYVAIIHTFPYEHKVNSCYHLTPEGSGYFWENPITHYALHLWFITGMTIREELNILPCKLPKQWNTSLLSQVRQISSIIDSWLDTAHCSWLRKAVVHIITLTQCRKERWTYLQIISLFSNLPNYWEKWKTLNIQKLHFNIINWLFNIPTMFQLPLIFIMYLNWMRVHF